MLKCGKYIIDTLDATALVSLRYATWLAQNMRAIFLANQMQYRTNRYLVARVFPRFEQFLNLARFASSRFAVVITPVIV